MAVGHERDSVSLAESLKANALFELLRETGLIEFRYLNITDADGPKTGKKKWDIRFRSEADIPRQISIEFSPR